MMEYCEFKFQPFDRNETVSSLNKLLAYLVEEDLLQYFPGIGNHIAQDVELCNLVIFCYKLLDRTILCYIFTSCSKVTSV